MGDEIAHPDHYCSHPSGVETIEIAKHESFCIGSAMKYLFRYKHKGTPIKDLRKAIKHIEFEIKRLEQIEADNFCEEFLEEARNERIIEESKKRNEDPSLNHCTCGIKTSTVQESCPSCGETLVQVDNGPPFFRCSNDNSPEVHRD
jgi:hypothetical protein